MDIVIRKADPNILYANTHLQRLDEHLFAVGFIAELLCKSLISDSKLATATFVAGCLHDLGKVDPYFQDWVKNPKKANFLAEDGQHIDEKFSFDKHPRHNEISVLLYELLDCESIKIINTDNKASIKHAIYWHHAKPFRKEKDADFSTYGAIYKKFTENLKKTDLSEVFQKSIALLKSSIALDKEYRGSDNSILERVFSEVVDFEAVQGRGNKAKLILPEYKSYEAENSIEKYSNQVDFNAKSNIIRACVITADRWISALDPTDLHALTRKNQLEIFVQDKLQIDSSLSNAIAGCLTNFPMSERTLKQSEIANQLLNAQSVSVLAGPAGCGKTKIALEWAMLKNAKQIIWVCPRVQICQGLFHELISEQYLPTASIEINTGEFKFTNKWDSPTPEEDYFSADIVITTIDQIFGAIITHTKANTLISFLNTHVVFDEYHEYINMPAFNLLFAELISCKQQQSTAANTLLVSATPHYFYLHHLLKIEREDIISMPSFNPSTYQIQFEVFEDAAIESSTLYKTQDHKTFVISNTALTAQKSFVKNQHEENAVLLHSKFKKSDKQKWFEEVYEAFKKDGTGKFNVLRSGPIVQASLNISCEYMISEMTTAENMLQRLGRLDRFGQRSQALNILTICITQDVINGKSKGKSSRFLNSLHSLQSAKAWYQFLIENLSDNTFKLPDLYELYVKFYQSKGATFQALESDMLSALKQSVLLINNKVVDPIVIPPKKESTKSGTKISKNSIRGDNRFVQLAVCDVTDRTKPVWVEQYAYQAPINERDGFDNLTASTNEIRGYEDSEKDLLAHMKNKHHNIFGGAKAYKDFVLLNEARDPEFPVYLSYTPNDLDRVGGESARHSHAIYYAICDKQPIGAISIKQLITNED
jgi:CRISPR-associated endonuclease/helicase Cas3